MTSRTEQTIDKVQSRYEERKRQIKEKISRKESMPHYEGLEGEIGALKAAEKILDGLYDDIMRILNAERAHEIDGYPTPDEAEA